MEHHDPCGDDSPAQAAVILEVGVGDEKEWLGQDFGEDGDG
jgi:hypothetical protein